MKPAVKFWAHPALRPVDESRLVVWDVAKMVGGYAFDRAWGVVRKFIP